MNSRPASVQRLSWLLLVLGLVVSVWLVRTAEHRAPPPVRRFELSDTVPEGPALLVTLDIAALGPGVARQLFGAGGNSWLGLQELCGFEPVLALRRVALALPPGDVNGSQDFALIADTTLESEPVLRCAEALIRKRGGEPARSTLGGFVAVRDRKKPLGEMAIRSDGLFVLSGGEYFRAVLDAASGARGGDEAARLRSAVHVKARGKLGKNQIALSALPGSLLPLPGVQAIALGVNVEQNVRLRGAVYCASASDCHDFYGWLRAEQSPLFAGFELAERGAELEVSGQLTLEQLGAMLSQLLGP